MTVHTELQARALTAIRRTTPRHKWDAIADIVPRDRQKVEGHPKAEPPNESYRHLLPQLKAQSHARLPLTVPNVDEVRRYFEINPVYKGSHILSFDVLNDPRLVDLIAACLDCVPTLYPVNAWWPHPASKPETTNVQYFHRDTDDWRFVTLFIYLTDVDANAGPHQLVRKASWWPRGLVPRQTARFVVWARYGLGPNTNSADLEMGPLSVTAGRRTESYRRRYAGGSPLL